MLLLLLHGQLLAHICFQLLSLLLPRLLLLVLLLRLLVLPQLLLVLPGEEAEARLIAGSYSSPLPSSLLLLCCLRRWRPATRLFLLLPSLPSSDEGLPEAGWADR